VGVLVGVAVGPPLSPDGPGIAAVSSRMSSMVASTALELVAPMRTSEAWALIVMHYYDKYEVATGVLLLLRNPTDLD
jgi:hypothetical protein